MSSRALTISFLASGGVHVALLGGLMLTGFQVAPSGSTAASSASTVIDFGSMPKEVSGSLPPLVSEDAQLRELAPVVLPPHQPPAEAPMLVKPLVELEPPEVKLGIDDGRDDSKNWIGFKDPTEFRAPKSTVDQAEVSLNPGQRSIASGAPGKPGDVGRPGIPGEAAPAAPATASAPEASATPTPPTSTQVPPTLSPTDVAKQQSAATQRGVKGDGPREVKSQEEVRASHATLGKAETLNPAVTPFDGAVPASNKGVPNAAAADEGDEAESREAVEKRDAKTQGSPLGTDKSTDKSKGEAVTAAAVSQPSAVVPAGAATPASAPSPTPASPSETGNQGQRGSEGNNASGANVTGDKAGEKDDREADASAVVDSIEVVPGKPAAANGLRIQTSRPQWSMATKLTARPRNPTVRITFGPTGRVVKAEFEKGKSTGYTDVDQPLLNAMYRWTARGEAIDKLNPANPRAGVTISVNILLN